MSVVGIDIGNAFCVVGYASMGKGGVDVILNEEFKRETPTCVAMGERQRLLGAATASPPPGTTAVSQIKRLIGRPLCDPALQNDLKTLFPKIPVTADSQGYPLLHFQYRGGKATLSPTQLLGMLLGNLKRSAERQLSTPVSDCCIAVPAHFNDVQRRAVLHAAEIAGLRPLGLLHECSAAVLEYGIYRKDDPVDPRARGYINAIVDVGHSATQVVVAEFWVGGATILARAADPDLGGRDFDNVLFDHFVAKLVAKDPDLDVTKSARDSTRLRASCEKVKHVLSANPDATLTIEDKDASVLITREEFERICDPLLVRLRIRLQKVLAESRLKPEDVQAVELIGSASRVPAVVRVVSEVFQQEPRRTLNASECVARGCALRAAMLSGFPSKKFEITEHIPFAIDISCKGTHPVELPSQILTNEDTIPTRKVYSFNTKEDAFSFDLSYSNTSEKQLIAILSTWNIGPVKITHNGSAELKIAFKLNENGIISIDSVVMFLGKDGLKLITRPNSLWSLMMAEHPTSCLLTYGKHPKYLQECTKDAPSIDTSENTPSHHLESNLDVENLDKMHVDLEILDYNETPDHQHQHNDEVVHKEKIDRQPTLVNDSVQNSMQESQHQHTLSNDPAKRSLREEVAEVQVPFSEHVNGVLSVEELKEAMKKENEMRAWDREEEDTKGWKNALESYVYEMRIKLRGKYKEFVSDSERQWFTEKLQEAEDWLYNEGGDVNCGAYIGRLNEFKEKSDPVEKRFKESSEREPALDRLVKLISNLKTLEAGSIPNVPYINEKEKHRIRNESQKVESWLKKVLNEQHDRPKYEDPVFRVEDIQAKIADLERCLQAKTSSQPAPSRFSNLLKLSRLPCVNKA